MQIMSSLMFTKIAHLHLQMSVVWNANIEAENIPNKYTSY